MSRPTEDRKDKVIKVRISVEKYDELMKEGKNLSETIRRKLNGGSFVPQRNAEIESMADCVNIEYDELLSRLAEMMLSGEISISGSRIGVTLPNWAERFREVCHNKGLNEEKVAESAIKALEKGLL